MGERRHDAAGNIAEDFRLAPDRLTRQTAADVAVDRMRDVGAGTERHETHARDVDLRFSQIGCRISGRVPQLGGHDDFRQLFSDMGFLVDVVRFSGQRCSPQDDIADRRFAA